MDARKIKIGFFIDAYKPGAGTENQLRGILQHLDRDRVDAVLITLREPVTRQLQSEISWPVKCLQVGSLLSAGAVIKFGKLVKWLRRERFDIAMIYFVDTNFFVVPACRLAKVKSIVVNRRDMGYWYTPLLLRRLNLVNRLADYFLVNSESIKSLVADKERFPLSHIRVVYNGMWDRKTKTATITREDLGIPSSVPVVGIVANLRPVKRLDRFVEMAGLVSKENPDARFLILGQGDLESDLKRRSNELSLEQHIMFLGQIEDVGSYLPLFDVGVLTSESEGLSNTLIEYAAAGVPTVAFDIGGNREVIQDGVSGFLVPDGDTRQMADKIVGIITDNELKQELSRQSRKSVVERLSPESVMRQLMAFFEEIR